MKTHTPGPWNTIWVDGTHVIDANSGKTDVAHVLNRGNPDTTEANARLLAAAPDLLAALKVLVLTQGTLDYLMTHDPKALEQASHAMQRAEGGAQ